MRSPWILPLILGVCLSCGRSGAPRAVHAAEKPLSVACDLLPGEDGNALFAAGFGLFAAGLAGSAEVPALAINPLTVRLARADGRGGMLEPLSARESDELPPLGDGEVDLVLLFPKRDLVQRLGLEAGTETDLILTGRLLDGRPFEGRDRIVLR